VAPAGQDKRIHIALCPFRWSSTAYMRLLGPSLSNRLFCTQTLTTYGNLEKRHPAKHSMWFRMYALPMLARPISRAGALGGDVSGST
jgi:hypothetical protein